MSHELRYHPDAEQLALVEGFNNSLQSLLPVARLHQSQEESSETWSQLEAIGLFSICLSEAEHGAGLGATEEALIAMELGRCLAAPSVMSTIGRTHATPKAHVSVTGEARRTAPGIRRDDHIVLVQDNNAGLVLVRDGDQAFLAEYPQELHLLEDRLWLTRFGKIAGNPEPLARFDPAGLRRLHLLDAAYLAGIAEATLTAAVDYSRVRKQFGRAIGSFQAIKHHCANMAMWARWARDLVGFAAVAIDDAREDAGLQVDCALQVAGSAALKNAGLNIQVHGGIGFSDEADPHLFLKRTQLVLALAGGLEAVNARIASIAEKPELRDA